MNEEEIFHQALAHADPEERAAYLDRACAGSAAVRASVEALLRANVGATGFLDPPAVPVVTTDHPNDGEGPGTIIGPYKLIERIGEGGFGLVFVAEQQHPVRRLVALKLIKPGMDSKQVLARFEAERQALALMDHPHIAKVLDAGAAADGRPYFVMELVKGVPITRFCDERRLTPRERLELFVPVCQAVQHAHQKGIIHRDIKPSNVLVALYDDLPVPKVIDFGVAKAAGQPLTEKTLHTGFGAVVGTPEYMSPEQAGFNQLDVDTRSDIYSLGVLLYELLAGSPPFSREGLERAGVLEMLRVIREEEPSKPSTKLSTAEGLPTLAANRGTEPARLTKLLRGELDWVVMKALEKDRNRRYETAIGFAMDVQRYLADEAVLACPPSASYRLRKFVRKNRGPLTMAASVFLLLVAGIAGTSIGLVRANRATDSERLAKLDAEEQKERALQSAARETEERKKAKASADEANAVVKFVEENVYAAGQPKGQEKGLGHDVTLRDAVKASLSALSDGLKYQPLIEARLRHTQGRAFMNLGEYAAAAEQFERVLAIHQRVLPPEHPDTLTSMQHLAGSYGYLGRNAEAMKLHEETLAARRRVLPPEHPDTLTSMHQVAISLSFLGRNAESVKLHEETLAARRRVLPPDHLDTLKSMHNLAISYGLLGRHAEALKLQEETLAAFTRALHPDDPDILRGMNNLANSYKNVGRNAEAVKLHEETLAARKRVLPPEHPDTLRSMHNLADSYAALGRHAEAIKLYEEALAARRRVLPPNDSNTLWSMHNLAHSYAALGRHAEAIPLLEEVLAKAERPGGHPKLMALATSKLAQYYQKKGDLAGCRKMVERLEKLNRTDAGSLYEAASYRAIIAALQAKAPEPDAARLAREEADKAMAWLQKAVAAGWKDVARTKKDPDLDFLRDRADFKRLVADLERARKD